MPQHVTSHDGRSRWAHYRDRQRGEALGLDRPVPPQERDLKPCGTWAAVVRHRRNGEPICDECKAEVSRINASNYQKRQKRLSRLADEHPDLHADVKAGKLTLAQAEAKIAG